MTGAPLERRGLRRTIGGFGGLGALGFGLAGATADWVGAVGPGPDSGALGALATVAGRIPFGFAAGTLIGLSVLAIARLVWTARGAGERPAWGLRAIGSELLRGGTLGGGAGTGAALVAIVTYDLASSHGRRIALLDALDFAGLAAANLPVFGVGLGCLSRLILPEPASLRGPWFGAAAGLGLGVVAAVMWRRLSEHPSDVDFGAFSVCLACVYLGSSYGLVVARLRAARQRS